jgi:aspartyl-tRNA synthetase
VAAGFAAAGVTLPTPFPRITYDESMRQFGTDKPDLRLPGLTDVRSAFTDEALATLQIDPALPVVAFRIPNVGELSRKEREDNHPIFDLKKGAKVHRRFQAPGQGLPRGRRQGARTGRRGRGRLRHHRCRRPGHPVKASDTKFEGRSQRARDQCLLRRRQLPHRAGQKVCRAA